LIQEEKNFSAFFGQYKGEVMEMTTAKIGDLISFEREGKPLEGVVSGIRENSVMVEYGFSKEKNVPLKTIVNHKNYKLKKSSS
jgi:uncharacterized protein YkvS